jgi:hypothetical protein
MSCAGADAQLH